MALESTITKNILAYLNSIGVAEKVHGSIHQSGRPDINACISGQAVRIEVKTDDNNNVPSKKQLLDLAVWRNAKAVCFVAYTLEDVKFVIRKTGAISCFICFPNNPDNKIYPRCPVKYCKHKGGETDG